VAASLSRLHPAELDLLACPGVGSELPGLAAALDEPTMEALLAGALQPGGHGLDRCRPRSMRYLPGRGCIVRYDGTTGAGAAVTVTARLHSSAGAARREHAERLRPLAGRPGAAGTVALLPGLAATASVYPVDAGLPTLLDAADPARVEPMLAQALGRRLEQLQVTAHRYSRSDRAMLRYQDSGHTVAYGKVAADDRGAHASAMLAAAGRALARRPAQRRFDVPRPLGYAAPMRLQLVGLVPGDAVLSDLLRARAHGGHVPDSELTAAVAGCACVAATLHGLELRAHGQRSAGGEIDRLRAGIAALAPIAPGLGAWLEHELAAAEAGLEATPPLPARPSHGDLKHNQILSDGRGWALVDFDTLCLAEPALDVGHFLAYLRLKATGAGGSSLASGLPEEFLAVYTKAAATGAGTAALRDRVRAYERLSLLGRAVHSWQKRKPRRLEAIVRLLEEWP
jgi:streptomycin 6-kinase